MQQHWHLVSETPPPKDGTPVWLRGGSIWFTDDAGNDQHQIDVGEVQTQVQWEGDSFEDDPRGDWIVARDIWELPTSEYLEPTHWRLVETCEVPDFKPRRAFRIV